MPGCEQAEQHHPRLSWFLCIEVSVYTHEPKDPGRYESFDQDGTRIYYSPKLGRKSDVLEFDYVRILFRSKPIMSGPEDLVAEMIMGRF